jgi:hypothetical protein
MKVDDTFKSHLKEPHKESNNDNKKFKLKLKEHGLEKAHKSGTSTGHGKFMIHPHSYREHTKSPKFKRYVIDEDDEKDYNRKSENPKNASSVKNLTNQSYHFLFNESVVSMEDQTLHTKKTRK